MKNFMAITSIGLCMGFAIALVNADDQQSVERDERTSIMENTQSQQPGTTESAPSLESKPMSDSSATNPSVTSPETSSNTSQAMDTQTTKVTKSKKGKTKNRQHQQSGEVDKSYNQNSTGSKMGSSD